MFCWIGWFLFGPEIYPDCPLRWLLLVDLAELLPTSAFGLDFLDMGDPALCLLVPRLRHCLRVMDFASDIDPGRIFRRGHSVSPWVGHLVLSLWLVSRCLLRLLF